MNVIDRNIILAVIVDSNIMFNCRVSYNKQGSKLWHFSCDLKKWLLTSWIIFKTSVSNPNLIKVHKLQDFVC